MTIRRVLEISTLGVSGLLVAMAVAWLFLGQINFSYGFWHDYGGIKESIEQYGPSNSYKTGFELTTKAQRVALFGQINRSINNQGSGLESIIFEVPGQSPQTLLREPEILHLQDVARLIDAGLGLAMGAFVLWLVVWVYFALTRRRVPNLWQQCIAIGTMVGVSGLVVALIGPVKVFYWLHTVLFPDNHQWFFYYQESLMSTMMFAPVLFGWIALEWLIVTLALFVLLQGVSLKLLNLFLLGK